MPEGLKTQGQLETSEHSHAGEGNGASHPALRHEVQDVKVFRLIRKLYAQRRRAGLIVGVALLASVVYLLGSRAEYSTGAMLMPEKQTQSGSLGNLDLLQDFGGVLGGLAPNSLLGDNSNALPVEIYPEIARSTPIMLRLLDEEVRSPSLDSPTTLRVYLSEHKPFSMWEGLGEAASWLIVTLKGGADDPTPVVGQDSSIIYLSYAEMKIVEDLQKRVTADHDQKTGILNIGVTIPDPYVAAQVANSAVSELTNYITRYRLRKLEQNVAFVEGRYLDAKDRANRSLDQLASFRDRNQNLSRNLAMTEEQRLEAEYELAFSVYSNLATKLEEARIKVQEHTPVFEVLQPVTVPLEKSRPRTLLVLTLGLLAGIVAAVVIVGNDVTLDRVRRTLRP